MDDNRGPDRGFPRVLWLSVEPDEEVSVRAISHLHPMDNPNDDRYRPDDGKDENQEAAFAFELALEPVHGNLPPI